MEIKRAVFDVDGVFTNGKFIYSEKGKIYKEFGAHDGDGIKSLREHGISIFAISADKRGFNISKARMDDLGIELELVSEIDRLEWLLAKGDPAKTFFMGDGFYDAICMGAVGYSVAPANALVQAKQAANYVTKMQGGSGAVFEASMHIISLIKKPKGG